MNVNRISNISFRENTLSREMKADEAILMLRDPKAKVKFQKSQEFARKADSVDTNPIVSLGYKLIRAFKPAVDDEENKEETNKLNKIA